LFVCAGEHKGASAILLGDAKDDQKAIANIQEQMARVHAAFKAHVAKHRRMADVEQVGTGQVGAWVGR
jgi:ClpP class serine protease